MAGGEPAAIIAERRGESAGLLLGHDRRLQQELQRVLRRDFAALTVQEELEALVPQQREAPAREPEGVALAQAQYRHPGVEAHEFPQPVVAGLALVLWGQSSVRS